MLKQEDKKDTESQEESSTEDKEVIILDDYLKRENPYKDLKVPKAEVHGVAVIDTANIDLNYETKENLYKASHMALVKDSIDPSVPIIETYDASSEKAKVLSNIKIHKALEKILETHKESGVKVVNASYGAIVSLKSLNILVQRYSLEDSKPVELTRENIDKHSELIKSALSNVPETDREWHSLVNSMLKQAELYEELISQGVLIVAGAGNKGKDAVDLLTALVPDVVVVGGLGTDVVAPHEKSGNSALNDAWASYDRDFYYEREAKRVIEEDGTVTSLINPMTIKGIGGTSLAAPQLLDEVIDLQKQGFNPSQINAVLRVRSKYQLGQETDKIVLADLNNLENLSSDLDSLKNNDKAFVDTVIESNPSLSVDDALRKAKKIMEDTREPIISKKDLIEALKSK